MRRWFLITVLFMFGVMMHAQSFEPKWVGEVNILKCDGDTVAIPTEKATAVVKTGASVGRLLTGIGNINSKVVIKGKNSPVQVSPLDTFCLVIRAKSNSLDPSNFIQIVKFEEKKKERRANLATVNWVGNVTEGNMKLVPYEADSYGNYSYILMIEPEEGEYGVKVLNPDAEDDKVALFYCFGIHHE